MTAVEIVDEVLAAGGALVPNGSRIHYQIPEQAAALLDELRRHKPGVLHILQRHFRPSPAFPWEASVESEWARKAASG